MKKQEEIVERIHERELLDVFGFEISEYILALNYEHAKPFLKDDVVEKDWSPLFLTEDDVRKRAVDYMPFAWDKANNGRGISAYRSLAHYQAWLWLMGDDELWPTLYDYKFYGKPQLRKICEFLGLDPDQWDNGVRSND